MRPMQSDEWKEKGFRRSSRGIIEIIREKMKQAEGSGAFAVAMDN